MGNMDSFYFIYREIYFTAKALNLWKNSLVKLSPQILLNAYAQGIFPMADADESEQIYWYAPDPRAIIPLDGFHISRSLKRTIKKGVFEIRFDYDFRGTMTSCAAPAKGREETWISDEIIDLYCYLHEYGFAHSVESYQDGELVGGVYGLALNGLFAGESMFSRKTDASKVVLAYLLRALEDTGYSLFDVQFLTNHLASFGAVEISKRDYLNRLEHALSLKPRKLSTAKAFHS